MSADTAPAEMPVVSHESASGERKGALCSTAATQAPAAMPGEMAKLVAKAMADRRLELINEPLARIWGELAATAIAAVRAHQFAHGQPAEAALAAEHDSYQQAAVDTVALLHDAEAKLAGLRQAILDADIICDDDEKAGDRLARLADHIRARTRDSLGAAAIRAQGE